MENSKSCGVRVSNICFFSGDITRSGGTERVSTLIVNELKKDNNIDLCILSMWENNVEPFFPISEGIKRYKLYQVETKGIHHFFGYIFRLRKFIKKNKIKILVDIDGILDMYSIPASLGLDVRIVSWEHFGFYSNPFVNYRKMTRRIAAWKAKAIVVLTNKDKRNYESNLKIKGNIRVIHNPIIMPKNEVYYDGNSKIILSVGRLSYDKGFDMLIEIAKDVFEKHPDWQWIIAGDGEEKHTLEDKISEYSLNNNIKLVGNIKNISKLYEEAAIFACTSRYEGFGLVITEAKTHKLPCISFRCPEGPSEIISNNKNGYLIDCFDIGDFAKKINHLIENDIKRRNFSENALDGLDKFQLDIIINHWKELISELELY